MNSLRSHHTYISDEALRDLGNRLFCTRWSVGPPGPAGERGIRDDVAKAAVERWRRGFEWREWEAKLNAREQFMARVDGTPIHFLVERGSGENPLPLILSHGWPGSMFELLPVVDRLAHPERFGGEASDGFTVVLPHLPGFALSPPPAARLTPRDIATLWHKLMTEVLSYPRYAAHGGDWGSVITAWLAYDHPQDLAAIHLTMAAMHPGDTFAADPPDGEEQEYIAAARERLRGETAYQQIHGEKPDTLAFALADSPAGLGAWMLEKFYRWSDPDLLPELDAMLATISAYWFHYSHPADWLYHTLVDRSAYTLPPGGRIEVPSAFCLFPHDIAAIAPDRWLKRLFNVSRVTRAPQGGHFPGLEQPAYLADDILGALATAR